MMPPATINTESPAGGQTIDPGSRLWTEQVRHLFARAPVGLLATAITALILAGILWNVTSRQAILVWVGVNIGFVLACYHLVRSYRRADADLQRSDRWYSRFVVLLGCLGMALGSAGIILFPSDSPAHQMYLTFLLGGLLAGSVGAFSVTLSAFLAYSVPTILPVLVKLLSYGSGVQLLMGGILLVFSGFMILNAHSMGRMMRGSFKARLDHLVLIDSLTAEKVRAEKAAEALEHEMVERVETQRALRESELQFRMLVETLNEGLSVVNEHGIIDFVNERLCEIVGYSEEELLGKPVADLFEEPFRPRFEDEFFLRRVRKRTANEMELVTPAGARVTMLVAVSPLFDDSRTFRGVIAAITDITYLKRAECKLRESEEKYRMIFENSPLGIIHFDRNGRVTACNPAFGSIAGADADQLLGVCLLDYLEDEGMKGAIRTCLSGKSGYYEGNYRSLARGSWSYLKADYGSIQAEDGSSLGGIGIIQDVSDSKRAEREMQDQVRFLQTLINTIPNPIFYKDVNGVYFGCNRAFEERMGLKREEIIGKTVYDILPHSLAQPYEDRDKELLANRGEDSSEAVLLYADGTLHSVIVNKATFSDADGNVAGLVGVDVDITERKLAEEELRRAHDELEKRVVQRTAELATANEELRLEIHERKKAEEALRESSEKLKLFAYSVAHDLKSPAIGIFGLTRLLHKYYSELLDERGNSYCDQILRSSEHLAALVDEINVFVSAKEAPLRFESIQLQEILRMVREEFSPRLSLREIQWAESVSTVEIRADRLSLLRLLRNLVDNALKYGGDPLTEIRIDHEEQKETHLFSVSDNGVGIDWKDTEKIFGLFQRNSTSQGIEGTGLGLAIVKEIVERHGGEVWVEPREGGGTTFHFTLSKSL